MRTDEEIYSLILDTALSDDRIEAVIMNGSRVNPNAPCDRYQDFDIIYVVKETASFIADKTWCERFGDKLIFQFPDEMDKTRGHDVDFENKYAYLMQFTDGTRIDLTISSREFASKVIKSDSLSSVLLDKTGMLPSVGEPCDVTYYTKRPVADEFSACCNEFWWLSLYVAKGLCRKEILYALDILNNLARPELFRLLSWYAGMKNDFSVAVGKFGKYIHKYIESEIYARYLATYSRADIDECWDALFTATELFYELERETAQKLGLTYDAREAENVMWYARKMRKSAN